MPRNMSFSLTTKQVRKGTKTETRRDGWWNLKPGEIVNACVKCMGLKKGEKIEVIRQIRIVRTDRVPLCIITEEQVFAEGFPNMTPNEFIDFWLRSHGKRGYVDWMVNRIRFEYP